ncbi:MAG: MFS transporter [Planctomycetes bacterium]|nr:MFS transporter [Planctomycetota bacterium]
MRIKKLFVRMLIAVILGLCAGILMEYSSLWTVFPVFLIIGVLACIFVEIVIEVLICAGTITREDLRKMKKPILRILVAASIGLLAGTVLEYAAIWAGFPFFLILGVLVGFAVGITIELVRYSRSMRRAFLEGKGLGMEHLPVNTAELIRRVIKKMRYKKEVRTEVMTELAEHFEDELKDCKTDEEKQGKAQQLIDEFGDTKLLAILLRRAKKRCRPLWRTVVARTFQAVGMLVLCFIVYAVWFSTGKPTISVDYLALLNQMNRPEVRDEDNAWSHYEKAVELYVEPDQRILKLTENRRKDFKKRFYFSDLNKDKQDMIRKWLKENESDWNSLELSRKQLFKKCFNEGLVPYIDFIPVYMRPDPTRRYSVFDNAVKDFIWRIEREQESGKPVNLPEYLDYEVMMEMEIIRGGGGYYGGGNVGGRS